MSAASGSKRGSVPGLPVWENNQLPSKSATSASGGAQRVRTTGPQRINVHWATLQLPPSLIDYVLVHELAHLREANHTPEFWSIVARLMPGYQSEKSALASVGRSIWLGTAVK